jgi:hypothetical protein
MAPERQSVCQWQSDTIASIVDIIDYNDRHSFILPGARGGRVRSGRAFDFAPSRPVSALSSRYWITRSGTRTRQSSNTMTMRANMVLIVGSIRQKTIMSRALPHPMASRGR